MPRQTTFATTRQPDPSPFPYADYVHAKKTLQAALRGPCCYALVTGASGMGKTELCRDISGRLEPHRYQIVYLASANLSLSA